MKNISIKRATGNYQYKLIKQQETKFYNLVVYQSTEPVYGGLYVTALLTKHNTELKSKNGLCLDAAMEVFSDTLKQLVKS